MFSDDIRIEFGSNTDARDSLQKTELNGSCPVTIHRGGETVGAPYWGLFGGDGHVGTGVCLNDGQTEAYPKGNAHGETVVCLGYGQTKACLRWNAHGGSVVCLGDGQTEPKARPA